MILGPPDAAKRKSLGRCTPDRCKGPMQLALDDNSLDRRNCDLEIIIMRITIGELIMSSWRFVTELNLLPV